jgi:arylamine N-acetyltransferase
METSPPLYSAEQIQLYFERIRLPAERRIPDVSLLPAEDALDYLADLLRFQLVTIPFENLSLHYSVDRRVSLHVEDVFEKIVGSGSRGGYCMENNLLFSTILRSLGFQLYTPGARVFEGGSYGGW